MDSGLWLCELTPERPPGPETSSRIPSPEPTHSDALFHHLHKVVQQSASVLNNEFPEPSILDQRVHLVPKIVRHQSPQILHAGYGTKAAVDTSEKLDNVLPASMMEREDGKGGAKVFESQGLERLDVVHFREDVEAGVRKEDVGVIFFGIPVWPGRRDGCRFFANGGSAANER